MLASLPQLARILGRILAGRPAPIDPSTITDPLAVYSFVMGYEADRVNMLGITHTLKLARRWRENPHERIVTPEAEARFIRAEQVAPQILAIDAEMRALQTPKGSRAHFAKLRAEALQRGHGNASGAELRAMGRRERIRYNMTELLLFADEQATNPPSAPPPRLFPYLATTGGKLTPVGRAPRNDL
jgi:hypothetical protein